MSIITPVSRRARLLAVFAALGLLVTACGGDEEVGTDLSVEEGAGGAGGIRDTTTTTAAPTTTTTAAPDPGAQTTTTAAPTTTTTQPIVVNEVKIQSDSEGFYFAPDALQVPVGQIVRFVNTDSVPRGILFGDGSVNSGEIPPGGHFDWLADRTGNFQYGDPTRPYTEGQGFVQVY